MKTLLRVSVGILLLGLVALPAQAFTSLYIFGDALSTTTNNTAGSAQYPQLYYGKRFSNGRIWVEVLAQRQGTPIANNWSYYDNDSASLVNNLQHFTTPIPPTALVIVWCNCSDIFDQALNGVTSQSQWNTAINQDQTNELNAIGQLHTKGARTLIMPTPVDLSLVPEFELNFTPAYCRLIRQESIAYNTAFSNTLNQARSLYPDLTIYEPNFFSLLNSVVSDAASYGLINAVTNLVYNGVTNSDNIDAIDFFGNNAKTNGLGDNYVFWDYLDPTAKFHEIIADTVQQQIAPAQVGSISIQGDPSGNTTNVLSLANTPVGLNGFVDGMTYTNTGGTTGWIVVTNFSSASPNQLVSFSAPPLPLLQLPSGNSISGPGGGSGTGSGSGGSTNSVPVVQTYRLRFPFNWSWP
jgi:phospholipase/lecithinase/hemolysin